MQTLAEYPEYELVRCLKRTDRKELLLFRHRELDRYIVQRTLHRSDAGIYQKLSRILHPNLLEIYEAIQDGPDAYIIEEYFDGILLSQILEDRKPTEAEIQKILLAVCNALEILHRLGIIHRDIKPQNIMLDSAGHIKLIDYDISKFHKEERDDDTTMLGTLGFAAPEQFGLAQSNERTDIFAVGVLLNVMLTGQHPSVQLCKGRWRRGVQTCTNIENAGRYKNVLELKKAILWR